MGIGKDSVALERNPGRRFPVLSFYLTGQHNQRLAGAEHVPQTQTPSGINHGHVVM